MFGKIILIGILILLNSANGQHFWTHDLVIFLEKLFEMLNQTLHMVCYLNWDKEEYSILLKHFWKTNRLITIFNFSNKNLLSNFVNATKIAFLINLNAPDAADLLHEAKDLGLFQIRFVWILMGNDNVEHYDFLIDSSAYFIKTSPNASSAWSIFKYQPNTTLLNKNLVLSWTKNRGIISMDSWSYSKNRSNLNQVVIKISHVVTNLDTLNHLWDYRNTHIDPTNKVGFLLTYYLTEYLNASRRYIIQRSWGVPNGTTGMYSGLIGDLQSGRADLSGSGSFLRSERIAIVDYFAPSAQTFARFILRSPPLSYVSNVFTLTFNKYVWYSCALLILLSCLLLYIIATWEWKDPLFLKKLAQHPDSLQPGIFEIIMLQIGTISQQGSASEPKSIAGRITMIHVLIALMFLYTCYCANIVALLQSTSDNVKTVGDLYTSRIKLGAENISYNRDIFENVKDQMKVSIYQEKLAPRGQPKNYMSVAEGIKRVREEFFGFHVELSSGYKMIGSTFLEHEKCDLKEVTYEVLREPWFALSKRSSYRKVMAIGMRKIMENGIYRRESKKIFASRPICHSKGSSFGSVGIIDCYFAFVLFGSGLVFSIVIFILEKASALYKAKYSHLLQH